MLKWWNKTSRLVKLILLIIPVVNWWVVLFVRFAAFLNHPRHLLKTSCAVSPSPRRCKRA